MHFAVLGFAAAAIALSANAQSGAVNITDISGMSAAQCVDELVSAAESIAGTNAIDVSSH